MEELSRLILLLLLAAIVINLLAGQGTSEGGPARVRRWAAAKFLGRS